MIVYANTGNFIHIGRAGENLATQVVFDISEYKKEWGEGKAQLLVEKDFNYYPTVCYQTGNKNYVLNVTADIEPGFYYFKDEENTGTVILFELVESVPAGSTLRYEPTNQEKFFTITQTINGEESQVYCSRKFIGDIEDYESIGRQDKYATEDHAGIMKLYQGLGDNTDGAVSQSVITDELDDKVELQLSGDETLVFLADVENEVAPVSYAASRSTTSTSTSAGTGSVLEDTSTNIYITENGTVFKVEDLDKIETLYNVYSKLEFESTTLLTGNLYVVWEITKADTQKPGIGKCSLTYYVNNIIKARSPIYSIIVTNALGDDQEEEPAEYNWVELVLDKATYVETKIDDAIQAAKDSNAARKVSEAWATGTMDGIEVQETEPQYQNNSKFWANMAQSWTRGGTGINVPDRVGEDTDNALYYYQLAKSWTVGDTGLREDEDTNNTKYWFEETVKKAEEAKDSQEAAAESEKNAKASEEAAKESQEDANGSAQSAAGSARAASNSASAAEGYKNNAAYEANQAKNAANDASIFAGQAEGSARDAESSARSASGLVDAAQKTLESAEENINVARDYVTKPPQPRASTGTWWVFDPENTTAEDGYRNTGESYDIKINYVFKDTEDQTALEQLMAFVPYANAEETEKAYGVNAAVNLPATVTEEEKAEIYVYTKAQTAEQEDGWVYLLSMAGVGGGGDGNMKEEEFDPSGEVLAAGGIANYVKENATQVTLKKWTAENLGLA